jgi:hypothetical protein
VVSVKERKTSGGLLGAALQLHSQSSTVSDQATGNASSKGEGATSERSTGSLLGVSIFIIICVCVCVCVRIREGNLRASS